jgi:2-oxoisovalerate dehydrogenase E1 component
MDRAEIVHESFLRRVQVGEFPAREGGLGLGDAGLSLEQLVDIFHAQVLSRQLDRISRKLQARGEGYYTIGSSGHEGNAAIAAACRPTDMAFLHYRDAAFQIARSRQVPGQTPLWDMLLSFTTSTEDPISGGRHKVLGSKALFIPPQTSTIASHLPKALGAAYSIGLCKSVRPEHQQLPDDALVLCSFGDASLNHSTSQGAFNSACWTAYQNVPLPLVFICEDNGIGISVKTPAGWVEATMSQRPGLEYFRCNGLDVIETYAVARRVIDWARRTRRPAFLHMSCVRLYGHAGADAQTAYLTQQQIDSDEADDPLLHTARALVELGAMGADNVLALYEDVGGRVARAAELAIKRPKLQTAHQVMTSLVPPKRPCAVTSSPSEEMRAAAFAAGDMRAMAQPQHMAKLLNFALTDLMLEHHEVVLAGEDVGRKGGVYGVTQRLKQRFGPTRVIDTLLDEQSILGLSIGMAHNGFIPIPEIQFLAYLHNAEDQLRGEAATLSFFSDGQFTNPMVVRIAGLGYQRGFGGHFHNDNSLAVLRDIPGLVIACPSNGRDAVHMLRECVRLAREEQRVVAFVEPIALYMTRDLHEQGDGLWTHLYPLPGRGDPIPSGFPGVHGDGTELAIVTYGNGFYLSSQAARVLGEQHNVSARIIDLRWLAPLPQDALLEAAAPCERVLVVDECRITGSQSEALLALFAERSSKPTARVAAEDSFIATGPSFGATLPSRAGIVDAALKLIGPRAMRAGV